MLPRYGFHASQRAWLVDLNSISDETRGRYGFCL